MSETPHTDRLAAALELARSNAVDGIVPVTIELFTKMVDEIRTVRELEAELSRYRAQGGLTPTYASGTHPPNLQGCTQERDHG